MLVADGFPGQRYRVLSASSALAYAHDPITARLLVTDAGYFPHARGHGRIREHGRPETILMLCTDGEGTVEVDGREQSLRAGQAGLLPRGVPHAYRSSHHRPWTLWWCHVRGPAADSVCDAVLALGAGPVVRIREVYRLVDLLETVLVAMERDETRASVYAAAGAAGHALNLVAAEASAPAGLHADRIELARDYLRRHLDTRLTVPELAATAGMSMSQFADRFRAATGLSVTAYLKGLRSARARELLATTDAPIAEIGRAVGYPDPFYFSRQFTAANGMSPTAFRAAARAGAL